MRQEGINVELYPSDAKMNKQMKYANNIDVPYVVLVGSKEMEANEFTIKNMKTGEQNTKTLDALLSLLSE